MTQAEYMEEKVPVRLFKDNDRYKDDVFVAVNGEGCLMRGKKIRPGDDVLFQGKHYTVAYAD